MFKVIRKEDDKTFNVYDIRYDAISGFPQFLIYEDNQWLLKSAKFFKPHEYPEKKLYESNFKDKTYKIEFEGGNKKCLL